MGPNDPFVTFAERRSEPQAAPPGDARERSGDPRPRLRSGWLVGAIVGFVFGVLVLLVGIPRAGLVLLFTAVCAVVGHAVSAPRSADWLRGVGSALRGQASDG